MLFAYLVGRILVGLYYLCSGFHHFYSLDMMARQPLALRPPAR